MSKLKSPRAKKAASLAHDRRNAYGENSKASRKNIPRAKARTQRAHRRAVHQALVHPEPLASEVEAERVEKKLTSASSERRSHGFQKKPDQPLGDVLAQKGRRRPE